VYSIATAELKERLEKLAALDRRTLADYVRLTLESHAAQHDKGGKRKA
jgi:predicted DNA-binding protein